MCTVECEFRQFKTLLHWELDNIDHFLLKVCQRDYYAQRWKHLWNTNSKTVDFTQTLNLEFYSVLIPLEILLKSETGKTDGYRHRRNYDVMEVKRDTKWRHRFFFLEKTSKNHSKQFMYYSFLASLWDLWQLNLIFS